LLDDDRLNQAHLNQEHICHQFTHELAIYFLIESIVIRSWFPLDKFKYHEIITILVPTLNYLILLS